MATSIQIVFDTADPDRLATFWAAALHYKKQDPPAGYASWEEFLKARGVPEEEWNSASAIVDPDGTGPRLYFQQLDTPKTGKNRIHLDINAGGRGNSPTGEAERADSRGSRAPARARREPPEGLGGAWRVLGRLAGSGRE